MLIPLGFLAASGVSAGSFDLLETQVLGSATSSVTFSSLSSYSSYQHLQVRATLRSTRAATGEVFVMQFNGDGASNYSWHLLEGTGSTVLSDAGTSASSMRCGVGFGSSGTANAFGAAVIDILDAYETTKNKQIRSLTGLGSIDLLSGSWRNTNALSSISLLPAFGGNLAIGSRFSLYGIKAA
jgi:hypothetical protein